MSQRTEGIVDAGQNARNSSLLIVGGEQKLYFQAFPRCLVESGRDFKAQTTQSTSSFVQQRCPPDPSGNRLSWNALKQAQAGTVIGSLQNLRLNQISVNGPSDAYLAVIIQTVSFDAGTDSDRYSGRAFPERGDWCLAGCWRSTDPVRRGRSGTLGRDGRINYCAPRVARFPGS